MPDAPRNRPHARAGRWRVGGPARASHGFPEGLVEFVPPRFLRRVRGRESFEHAIDGSRVIVKRFHGGEPRDWWSERARGLALRSPARAEAENLLSLRARGFAVPEPLAWAEELAARFNPWRGRGSSLLVQRFVEHERTLADGGSDAMARALGSFVGRLHAAGWCHRDLYLEHFLVTRDGLVLIDLGRARRALALARRWIVKDLAALLMSCPDDVPRRRRLRVLAAWRREQSAARRAGLRGAALARFVAAIEHKARRLRDHAPKQAFDRVSQRVLGPEGRA